MRTIEQFYPQPWVTLFSICFWKGKECISHSNLRNNEHHFSTANSNNSKRWVGSRLTICHKSREEELLQPARVYVYVENTFLSVEKGIFSGAAALEVEQWREGQRCASRCFWPPLVCFGLFSTRLDKYNIKYKYQHTTTAPSIVTEGVQWSTTTTVTDCCSCR